MKNAATDIVHFRGARLPFKQVKFNDPVCCVYGPDCSECEGIGLIAGDDVNAVEGDLRDNKFFTEDGLINLHYCFARLLLNCDSTARTADHAGDEITESDPFPEYGHRFGHETLQEGDQAGGRVIFLFTDMFLH